MRELHLFAGAGGGILGGMLLGHTCVCAVEIEPYFRSVLLQRQRDGILPRFPIWDNVCTFDGKPWRGRVDVICGGFPCQDISLAGAGAGINGERSGLWGEMARIIREVEPRFVLVENSPALVVRGLGRILGDLASMGFNGKWGVFSACQLGAPHMRKRLFGLFHSERNGWNACENEDETRHKRTKEPCRSWDSFRPVSSDGHGGEIRCYPNAGVVRGVDGMAKHVERFRASGNGQVPSVVALAWRTLSS